MTTETLLKLLAVPLRWLPDWVSNIPALQRHIHARARAVGVNGAILDFFENINSDQTCVVWLGSSEFEQKSAAFCNLDQLQIPPSNTSKHRRLHKSVLGEEELNSCAQVQSAFIQRHNLHNPPS